MDGWHRLPEQTFRGRHSNRGSHRYDRGHIRCVDQQATVQGSLERGQRLRRTAQHGRKGETGPCLCQRDDRLLRSNQGHQRSIPRLIHPLSRTNISRLKPFQEPRRQNPAGVPHAQSLPSLGNKVKQQQSTETIKLVDACLASRHKGRKLVGPPGLEPGTKGL